MSATATATFSETEADQFAEWLNSFAADDLQDALWVSEAYDFAATEAADPGHSNDRIVAGRWLFTWSASSGSTFRSPQAPHWQASALAC